jgi:adenylate cyclase
MNATAVRNPDKTPARRAWVAFVRVDLIGPIDALVGLGEVLAQETDGKRPDDYRTDIGKLRQAAGRLMELARSLLSLGEAATCADLEAGLRRARHDLGNRLNQLSGMVQLLQMQEDSLFGAFLADLDKMFALCRQCELGLMQQGSGGEVEEPTGGLSDSEIDRVAEQIRPADPIPADVLVGSVLIADDDPINREVLRRLLTHHGHEVAEAADGHQALRLLGERSFDVLLLDILMPGLNGFEVLQKLHEEGRLRRTSVIVVSALDEVHGLVRCLEAGADDYLTKPVDRMLLQARINSCLLKRRQHARELEQFFPPEVVTQLIDRPDLLQTGRSADVTILFCDIRGFSRVSERLRDTPEKMVDWVSAVMEALDKCVLRHQGVLVDFIGDELLAMWGAPQAQPDHARRACLAALDMLACISDLSKEWEAVTGEPTMVGIGINSGPASVGNTGTRRRFKYGPVGNTVNLASRIQGATKYLETRTLITQSTRDRIGDEFALRRVSRLQVVNIKEPVAVYELVPQGEEGWDVRKGGYEEALDLFEAGPDRLQDAARILGRLVTTYGLAGPNRFLLSRVLSAMQDRNAGCGVYVLPGK